jgi:hypothetical protein
MSAVESVCVHIPISSTLALKKLLSVGVASKLENIVKRFAYVPPDPVVEDAFVFTGVLFPFSYNRKVDPS